MRPVSRQALDQGVPTTFGVIGRPRAQTGVAFKAQGAAGGHASGDGRARRESRPHVDRFGQLQRAIDDLRKQTRLIDDEAKSAIEKQESVDKEIGSVVQALDVVQKSIDDYYFQQVRMAGTLCEATNLTR